MANSKSKFNKISLKIGEVPPADAEPPLISEGRYIAECVGLNTTSYHGISKICLNFKILNSPASGLILVKFFNYGYDPFPRGSDYYQAWVVAVGKRPGSRRKAILDPKVFHEKTFNIRVATVKPKNKDGSPKPDSLHYSKVGEVLSLASVGVSIPDTDSKHLSPSTSNFPPVTYNPAKK